MNHVKLPDSVDRPLPFYLAMEEYMLRRMDEAAADSFFMWQVRPTVIFGRNQVGSREVDLDYCREHGIEVYRRKSGGGCVFANRDNVMLSYITRSNIPVEEAFRHYTAKVVAMLRELGVNAEASSRNDILIDGRKVSGSAYYRTERGSIIHGTMLIDTDRMQMSRALTPSASKLAAKGVQSVAQRITTLREHIDIDADRLQCHAVASLCNDSITLSPNEITEIEQIAQSYYSDSWRNGFDERACRVATRRFDRAGEVTAHLNLNPTDATISGIRLTGDFFATADLDSRLLSHLHGVEYNRNALARAVSRIDIPTLVPGLTADDFLTLII